MTGLWGELEMRFARRFKNDSADRGLARGGNLTDAYEICDSLWMRTTLEIEAELLDEAIRVTGAPTKTAVVRMGLRALVDQAARRRLAALRGSLPEATAPSRRRPPAQESTR